MGIKLKTKAKKIPDIQLEPETPVFGELTEPGNPFADRDLGNIDLETIGQNYRIVPSASVEPVVEASVDTPPASEPVTDKRTFEDLRKEALHQIVNQLDVPEELVVQLQKKLGTRIDELTSFLLTDIVDVGPRCLMRAVQTAVMNVGILGEGGDLKDLLHDRHHYRAGDGLFYVYEFNYLGRHIDSLFRGS
jgi:hypothetical protein